METNNNRDILKAACWIYEIEELINKNFSISTPEDKKGQINYISTTITDCLQGKDAFIPSPFSAEDFQKTLKKDISFLKPIIEECLDKKGMSFKSISLLTGKSLITVKRAARDGKIKRISVPYKNALFSVGSVWKWHYLNTPLSALNQTEMEIGFLWNLAMCERKYYPDKLPICKDKNGRIRFIKPHRKYFLVKRKNQLEQLAPSSPIPIPLKLKKVLLKLKPYQIQIIQGLLISDFLYQKHLDSIYKKKGLERKQMTLLKYNRNKEIDFNRLFPDLQLCPKCNNHYSVTIKKEGQTQKDEYNKGNRNYQNAAIQALNSLPFELYQQDAIFNNEKPVPRKDYEKLLKESELLKEAYGESWGTMHIGNSIDPALDLARDSETAFSLKKKYICNQCREEWKPNKQERKDLLDDSDKYYAELQKKKIPLIDQETQIQFKVNTPTKEEFRKLRDLNMQEKLFIKKNIKYIAKALGISERELTMAYKRACKDIGEKKYQVILNTIGSISDLLWRWRELQYAFPRACGEIINFYLNRNGEDK